MFINYKKKVIIFDSPEQLAKRLKKPLKETIILIIDCKMKSLYNTMEKEEEGPKLGRPINKIQQYVRSQVIYCYKCDTYKNNTDFYKDNSQWNGFQSICKQCNISKSKLYYQNKKNLLKILEIRK